MTRGSATRTPSANPQTTEPQTTEPQTTEPPADDNAPDAKADSNMAKSDYNKAPDLFVVAYTHNGDAHVELLSEDQAEARVSTLTYGSKQQRKERAADDLPEIEGGGTHEIDRADIHVYRLNATEVRPDTDF